MMKDVSPKLDHMITELCNTAKNTLETDYRRDLTRPTFSIDKDPIRTDINETSDRQLDHPTLLDIDYPELLSIFTKLIKAHNQDADKDVGEDTYKNYRMDAGSFRAHLLAVIEDLSDSDILSSGQKVAILTEAALLIRQKLKEGYGVTL